MSVFRGPEIEFWLDQTGSDWNAQNDWSLMPFMALSDGAHTTIEGFSYFTLLWNDPVSKSSTSLFGIACTRQISAEKLKNKSTEVTRSTVQKSVVVLTTEPQYFKQYRESLSAVTNVWFAQGDFSDTSVLKEYQESLSHGLLNDDSADPYFGLSLREMVHEYKHQTLVLLKCLLLQRKMLFFGSRCERVCMMQFALISLIPGLLQCLQDCAGPDLDAHARATKKATSLKTSERTSLLAYMGLPLQIFGKGSIFGPYTPLQLLDVLADYDTKSYVVGSTNSLLLQQKEKYSDILINLDEVDSITITSPSLRTALALSAADRRWVDFLTQTVNDTWDPSNPSRPTNMGYAGSEEFIRLQFEEYLLALLSSTAYHIHHDATPQPTTNTRQTSTSTGIDTPTDLPNISDFNTDFITTWQSTSNFALFSTLTSQNRIFDIIEPRHPTAGGLSVEDIQRRLTQQVAELHLDERVREGREVLNKGLMVGRERVGKLWADLEAMRQARRDAARSSEQPHTAGAGGGAHDTLPVTSGNPSAAPVSSWTAALRDRATKVQTQVGKTDTAAMQAAARENAAKAGAYLNSWGSWARERGKEWSDKRSGSSERGGTAPVEPAQNSKEVSRDMAADAVVERKETA
jgi:Transport protein Avl9